MTRADLEAAAKDYLRTYFVWDGDDLSALLNLLSRVDREAREDCLSRVSGLHDHEEGYGSIQREGGYIMALRLAKDSIRSTLAAQEGDNAERFGDHAEG